MDLEIIMLSEINQTREDKYLFSITCGLLSEIGKKVEHKVERLLCGEKKGEMEDNAKEMQNILCFLSSGDYTFKYIHIYVT